MQEAQNMIAKKDMPEFEKAVNEVLFEKFLPLLFSEEQIKQMNEPYRNVYDHLSCAPIYSLNEELKEFNYFKPQLCVSDPRVPDELIERLPRNFDVEFKGQTYTLPLRIFKNCITADASEFEQMLEQASKFRKLAREIDAALSDKFNLKAGIDYDFRIMRSVEGDKLAFEIISEQAKNTDKVKLRALMEKNLKAHSDSGLKGTMIFGPMRPL
jgi:hypothetical protein